MHKAVLGQADDVPVPRADKPESHIHASIKKREEHLQTHRLDKKNSCKDAPSCCQSSQGGCSLNQRRNRLGVVINKM
jgi:hypothetical protein